MRNGKTIAYWIATGLFCLMMTASAAILVLKSEMRTEEFAALGFPPFLVVFLAIAKPLGVLAILTNLSAFLREWAYAGFFFNFLMAFIAHIVAEDDDFIAPLVAMTLMLTSCILGRSVRGPARFS